MTQSIEELSRRDRGCWVVFAHAPAGTPMRVANDAFNALVADRSRGLVLFHDHLADRPGGIAVFAVEDSAQRDAVLAPGPLEGWDYHAHPLIFARSAMRFVFQSDYTMYAYRGRRLDELWAEYGESEERAKVDAADAEPDGKAEPDA